MIRIFNYFVEQQKREIKIPFFGDTKPVIQVGEKFHEGSVLFQYSYRDTIASYDIFEELGLPKSENPRDYIARLPGEFVTEGEVLAEKVTHAGMTIKYLNSTTEGIINLDRIDSGFIDIVSEKKSKIFKSSFSGKVLDIDYKFGLKVEATVLSFYNIKISSIDKFTKLQDLDKLSGTFTLVKSPEAVFTEKELKSNYDRKVVWMGRHFSLDIAREIIERGASFVITNSIDVQTFRKLDIPVVVLSGFGSMPLSELLLEWISKLVGAYMYIDWNTKELLVTNADISKGKFVRHNRLKYIDTLLRVGDYVRILKEDLFGSIGTIYSISDDIVIVDLFGKRIPVEKSLIELVGSND